MQLFVVYQKNKHPFRNDKISRNFMSKFTLLGEEVRRRRFMILNNGYTIMVVQKRNKK